MTSCPRLRLRRSCPEPRSVRAPGARQIRPDQLFVAVLDGRDIARLTYTDTPDGYAVLCNWTTPANPVVGAAALDLLLPAVVKAAENSGVPRVEAVVVHGDQPDTQVRLDAVHRNGALHRNGFTDAETRWQWGASAVAQPLPAGVEQIAADDPRLVGAMADRLADTAVWLRHEGPTGVDGVALSDVWPDGVWMLTYLGVVPSTRGRGVGRRLASAVRSEAARAGATSVARRGG